MEKKKNIEAIFPLSHMQSGILFHALYEPESTIYFEQFRCFFRGSLRHDCFKRAWETVAARHQALRTFFVWEKQKKPLQVVRRDAALDWEDFDWRTLTPKDQKRQFAALLEQDRDRGFDLDKAPPIRFYLIRMTEERRAFIWSHHHILIDGWSVTCIFKEVFACYQAFCHGQDPELPRPRPYRDYISWLQRQDKRIAEAFWRKTLAGFHTPNPMPIQKNAKTSCAYRKQRVRLPEASGAAIADFAKGRQLTVNTLIHAAWTLLLSRYSGETDVVFGSTVSGRPPALPDVSSMVGLFINTLPVRMDAAPSAFLAPWLQDLQNHLADRDEHHYAPLVDIQSWSELPRGAPLFDSLLVFHNHPVERSLEHQQPRVEDIYLYEQTNYSLMVEAVPDASMILDVSYPADRFHEPAIARLINHFRILLEAVASEDAETLAELPMLSREEREQQLLIWNNTSKPYPKGRGFQRLFEERVQQTPDRPAVSFGEKQLTYAELNARADELSRALSSRGVGPETVTALFAERNIDFLIAVLAVLKAGGAFLPMDIHHPPRRIALTLKIAAPTLVLASDMLEEPLREGLQLLPEEKQPLVMPITAEGSSPKGPRRPRVDTDHLAYIIFTSGSTGTPKGVMIHLEGMVNHLFAKIGELGMGPHDVVSQNAPQSFDISVWQFLAALLVGGRTHIVNDEASRDPGQLIDAARTGGVTILEVVPSMLRIMLEEIERRESRPAFKALRFLMLTGEALPPEPCRAWFALYPEIPIVNAYGPTECSDDITHYVLSKAPGPGTNNTPIGHAVANTRLHVLDRGFGLLPAGCFGECHAGGAGVGRGYLNEPARTAQSFIPDPFSKAPGARLYKTGDRVRYVSDTDARPGVLEFHGRLDHQVKIRGFRIETGEIETVLREHEAVADAFVIVREASPGNQQLVAYLTPASLLDKDRPTEDDPASQIPLADLKDDLKSQLPDYMVPAAFVVLTDFPLTRNGKIDRQQLPEPDFTSSRQRYVPPRSRNELVLAEIWAESLSVERVGVYDDFFELGGHSIIATLVIARIRNAFQVEIPLREVFAYPVLAQFAERVIELRKGGADLEKPMVPVPRDKPMPLSFIQQQLWFLFQLTPDNPAYNVTRPIRIKGAVNYDGFKAAAYGLVKRHEILRTVFRSEKGVPYQKVMAEPGFSVEPEDFTHVPEEERETVGLAVSTEEAKHIFSLERGPLFYVRLLRFAEDDHILIFNLHHILSDLWSREIMVRDAGELYLAYLDGREPDLPELPIQFGDYATWQRGREHIIENQLKYWVRKLEDMPALELPLDRPRPPVFQPSGKTIYFDLPKTIVDQSKQFCKKESVTPFMLMLSAFNIIMSRYSGQDDIVVGTPVANRNYREVEDLIGFFLNTQVLRNDLSGRPTFVTLLHRVRETVLESYDHQDVPFDTVVEKLNPKRDLSRNPLFQVVFLYEPDTYKDFELPGLSFTYLYTERAANKLDFTLQLIEKKDGDGLTGLMEFNKEIFDSQTFERMHRQFDVLLRAVLANPKSPIDKLDILPEDERRALVHEWNDTAKPYPAGLAIHHLFEERAQRTPNLTAVQAGESGREEEKDTARLTYSELNRHADRLAAYLRAQGVAPETMVGICMERSLEMVVGLLGILKSGAAYVPLDPDYPSERLTFMVADARVSVLLTHKGLGDNIGGDARVIRLEPPGSVHEEDTGAHDAEGIIFQPDHPAYMIYTSGSTGKPKGVVNTHAAIFNRLWWMQETYQLTEQDHVLQKTPYSFDVSVWEFFWPLMIGARLVMAKPGGHGDPAYLARTITSREITTIHFVPSMLRVFLHEKTSLTCTSLRQIFSSGEALTPDLQKRFFAWSNQLGVPVHLHNLYGPTEAAVDVTYWPCINEERGIVPIGRPIDNVQTYILDTQLRVAPIGVFGELHLAGVCLARGYQGRPALTAETFIPNPFDGPGRRLYRTGDLVRYLPVRVQDETGAAPSANIESIEFKARIDHQVKIRGFRIELGEIEVVLSMHSGIDDAVVLAREDRTGDKRLVAYFTRSTDSELDHESIQTHCRKKLPEYMTPNLLVELETLPLGPNGKVDRSKLPEPEVQTETHRFVPPETPGEQKLAAIWSEILGIEKIGIHDDFFALGGHSLMAARVIAHVQDVFHVELFIQELFQTSTIRGLAELIEKAERERRASAPAIPKTRRRRAGVSEEGAVILKG